MGYPLVSPDELGRAMGDDEIDAARALDMISDAQTLCERIVSPLPQAASVVVKRVAVRGYISTMSRARVSQMTAGGSPFPVMGGGIWLSKQDIADLRGLAGGGGAFSIDLLPAGYTTALPWWDAGQVAADGEGISDWDVPS